MDTYCEWSRTHTVQPLSRGNPKVNANVADQRQRGGELSKQNVTNLECSLGAKQEVSHWTDWNGADESRPYMPPGMKRIGEVRYLISL